MLKTKTVVKKVTPKKMLKKKAVSKKITTVYGIVMKSELKSMLLPDNTVYLESCKENLNHTVNSWLLHNGNEDIIKDTVLVKMEIIGTPVVKTTREITIKTK